MNIGTVISNNPEGVGEENFMGAVAGEMPVGMYQDPGTPLEAETHGELFDNEDDSDDDVQITIGDIKANVSNVTFRSGGGQKGGGGGTGAGTGKLDMDATAEVNGTQIYDLDLANMTEKPWRKPGADITDYFNYGFTEDTWNMYCERQRKLRAEFGAGNANKILFSRLSLQGGSKEFAGLDKKNSDFPKSITNLAERFGGRRHEPIFRTVLTKPSAPAQEGSGPQVLPTVNLVKTFQPPPVVSEPVSSVAQNVPASIPVLTSAAPSIEPAFSAAAQEPQPPPQAAAVLVNTPAVPSPAVQPILTQMTQPLSTIVSVPAAPTVKTEPLEGPPGVDGEPEPPGGGGTPPPGAETPEMSVAGPSAIPTINTSVPPPRFGTDTSVPPPQRFNVPPPGYPGPPGVPGAPIATRGPPPGMPMTNVPPPNFAGGNPPPPGVPVGQRAAFGFTPLVRPPPLMRPTGPRMMRHPMENRYYGGSGNADGERSPASYSDKSSDMEDRDHHERYSKASRPRRDVGPRGSHRRGSSPPTYDRRRHRDEYHGSRSRHRSASRSRSPPSASKGRRRGGSEDRDDKKDKRKRSAKVKEEPPDEEIDEPKDKKKKRRRKDENEDEPPRESKRIKEEKDDSGAKKGKRGKEKKGSD